MSDALLTEISKKLSDIHSALKSGGGASSGGAVAPKPAGTAATKPAAAAAATATKEKPAAAAGTNKPAANKPAAGNTAPPAGTKAPGGKHTIEQVREVIRKVATNASLGKQSAADVLDSDGGGVANVTNLKPEFYDAVFEACTVLINGEGSPAAAPSAEDDLM